MRPDVDRYFMDMARLVASRSTCIRRSVGCVLVDRKNRVLATGYNGVPSGQEHCNDITVVDITTMSDVHPHNTLTFPHACAGANAESGANLDACDAVHAEQNAIVQCERTDDIFAAYVTAFPCTSCAKLLLNTGCREIVYLEPYGDDVGRQLWNRAGRLARQFEGEPHMIQRDIVRLFGEGDPLNEWRVVVACVCLNLAPARTARPIIMRLLERWPYPRGRHGMAWAGGELEKLLRPLGMAEKRAAYVRCIASNWGNHPVDALPGVGPYALESVAVFCRGELPDSVGDRKVAAWVAWRRENL